MAGEPSKILFRKHIVFDRYANLQYIKTMNALCLSWTEYGYLVDFLFTLGSCELGPASFLIRKFKATVPHRSPWASSLKITITRFTEVTGLKVVMMNSFEEEFHQILCS